MSDNITVLNSTGGTFTIRMKDVGSGVLANMSLPTDLGGNTMVSSGATFTSTAQSASVVVISSLSAPHTVVLSSNPTVIPSSAIQVTLTSNTVALSSVATVTISSASNQTVTSLTSGSVAITNGNNVANVMAASSLPTSSMSALLVAISPNGVNANGGTTSSQSAPVVPADQYGGYITVAQGQTQASLGTSLGRAGDYLAYVTVFPVNAACGVVTIFDSTSTTIGSFAGGGTTALPSLVPFMIPIGAYSVSSGWKVTTGSSVTALGVGKFT